MPRTVKALLAVLVMLVVNPADGAQVLRAARGEP